MQINRRQFLLLTGAQALSGGLAGAKARAAAEQSPAFLVFRGMDAETPADLVRAFVEPFLEAWIPFGVVVEGADLSGAKKISPGLAAFWAELVESSSDLVEYVVGVPDLALLEPYFQRRAVSDGMQAIAASFSDSTGRSAAVPAPISVACDVQADLRAYGALRALGIRNVLELGLNQASDVSGVCGQTMVCLTGSRRADFNTPVGTVQSWIIRPAANSRALLLEHGFNGIEGLSPAMARARGEAIVASIVSQVQGGRIYIVGPREHANWFSETSQRTLAIMVEAPVQDIIDNRQAFDAVIAELEAAGFAPGTTGPIGLRYAAEAVFCPSLATSASENALVFIAKAAAQGELTCALQTAPTPDKAEIANAGLSALWLDGRDRLTSFHADGLLRSGNVLSVLGHEATTLAEPSDRAHGDAILLVKPALWAEAGGRASLIDQLKAFRADPTLAFASVPRLMQDAALNDPVFELYQSARAARTLAAEPAQATSDETAQLLEDAKQAWAFISGMTNAETGLCPATVHFLADGNWLYRQMTMWDLASLILGALAAHELGLIDDAELSWRSEAFAAALPSVRTGGLRLPSASISTERRASLSRNFNVCDTGRLLSALRQLSAYPGAKAGARLQEIVANWDLPKVVVDGKVHSVRWGQLVNRSHSHCAHYTALGFRHWGIETGSPYEVAGELTGSDADMRLLYGAADIGAIGAEPLLLEAIEYGASAPTDLLADVLHSAQMRAHDETGQLHCVSEAPLNRAPWFTYQGLRLADRAQRWHVSSLSTAPEHNGAQFERDVTLVNSKAAFLWNAIRPGAYSDQLVAYIRDNARNAEGGFSPGIFAATGKPMANYADINTNGIILQAIAYILRGRRPRAV